MRCFRVLAGWAFILGLVILELQMRSTAAMPLQEVQNLRENLEKLVSLVLARIEELDRRDHIATSPEQGSTRSHTAMIANVHNQPVRAFIPPAARTAAVASNQHIYPSPAQDFHSSRKSTIYKPNYQRLMSNGRLYSGFKGPIYSPENAFERRSKIPRVSYMSLPANRKPSQLRVYRPFSRLPGPYKKVNTQYKSVPAGLSRRPWSGMKYRYLQHPAQGYGNARLSTVRARPWGGNRKTAGFPVNPRYSRFRYRTPVPVQKTRQRYQIPRYRYSRPGYQSAWRGYRTFAGPQGAATRRGYITRVRPAGSRYQVPSYQNKEHTRPNQMDKNTLAVLLAKGEIPNYQRISYPPQAWQKERNDRRTLIQYYLNANYRKLQAERLRQQVSFRRSRPRSGWPGMQRAYYPGYRKNNRLAYRAIKSRSQKRDQQSFYEYNDHLKKQSKSQSLRSDAKTENKTLRDIILSEDPDLGASSNSSAALDVSSASSTVTKNNTASNQSDNKGRQLSEPHDIATNHSSVQSSKARNASNSSLSSHKVLLNHESVHLSHTKNPSHASSDLNITDLSLRHPNTSNNANSSRSTKYLIRDTPHRVDTKLSNGSKSSTSVANSLSKPSNPQNISVQFPSEPNDNMDSNNREDFEKGTESPNVRFTKKTDTNINRGMSYSSYESVKNDEYGRDPDASGEDNEDPSGYQKDNKDPSTTERAESKNLGTTEHAESKNLGTTEHAKTEDLGTNESADSKNLGTTEHAESKNLGTTEHAKTEDLGTNERADSKNLGTTEHAKSEHLGTLEHAKSGDLGTIEHAENKDLGTIDRAESKNLATTEHAKSEDLTTTEHAKSEDLGTIEHAKSGELGTIERAENKDLGTIDRAESKNLGTTERVEKDPGTVERAAFKFAGIKKKLPLTHAQKIHKLYKSALYFAGLGKKEKASATPTTSGDDTQEDIDKDIDKDVASGGEGSAQTASGESRNQLLEATKDSTIMGEAEVHEALKSSVKDQAPKHEETVIDGGIGDSEDEPNKPSIDDQQDKSTSSKSNENQSQTDAVDNNEDDEKQQEAAAIDDNPKDDESVDVNEKVYEKQHEGKATDDNSEKNAVKQQTAAVKSSSSGVDDAEVATESIDSVENPTKALDEAQVSNDNQGGQKQPADTKKQTDKTSTKATESQKTPEIKAVTPQEASQMSSYTTESQDQQNQFSNEAGNGDTAQPPSTISAVGPEEVNTATDQSAALGPLTQAETQTQSLSYADSEPAAEGSQSPNGDNQAFTNENDQGGLGQYSTQQTYICKDTNQTISCPPDQSINVLNADYGDKGDVGCMKEWDMAPSGPCKTPGAVDIVKDQCDGQNSCELSASNEVFGDACPDGNKYLEVNYDCNAAPAIPAFADPRSKIGVRDSAKTRQPDPSASELPPDKIVIDLQGLQGLQAPQTPSYYQAPMQQQQPMAYAPQPYPAPAYYPAPPQPALPNLMSAASPYSAPNPCDSCNTCSLCATPACTYCQNSCQQVTCGPPAPPPMPPMPNLPKAYQPLWQQWNERTADMTRMEMSALIMSPLPKLPSAGEGSKETGSGETSADASAEEMDDEDLYDAADKKSDIPETPKGKSASS